MRGERRCEYYVVKGNRNPIASIRNDADLKHKGEREREREREKEREREYTHLLLPKRGADRVHLEAKRQRLFP